MNGGYIDLHSHYLPDVDDGVETTEQGQALCQGLAAIGFSKVVATPHIRTAMFENRAPALRAAFERFCEDSRGLDGMPELGLGCEHFCDDVVFALFASGEALPYPGGHAALVEFPDTIPMGVADQFFRIHVGGIRPVLAHPERYRPLFKRSEPIERIADMGIAMQLDVMSLVGKYGRAPRKAAERMLEEQLYFIASSDCHTPRDLDKVERAIERLAELVGEDGRDTLMRDNPAALLDGTADP